ncbi:MAG: aminopeptidase [Chloroflexota bacterium]
MPIESFDQKLQSYAEVIVQVGLNLQPGQRLMINAQVDSAPLVRAVAACAYRLGADYVELNYRDEQVDLQRFRHARRETFELAPAFQAAAALQHVQQGGAYLTITSEDPDLLKDQDPELVALVQKVRRRELKPVSDMLARSEFNWCIAGYPSPAWARRVFPALPEAQRIEQLWQALFNVCRVDRPDPVAAWREQVENFNRRKAYLTGKQYHALRLTAPGTDLTIGLAEGHRWMGGAIESTAGVSFIPNLPTEEVFTLPHRERIHGMVTASKPLAYSGVLIEDFRLTFDEGRVSKVEARQGEQALRKIIATDAGAASLGEVALVPHGSPVSSSGILFYNTLYDENAACHIALGNGLNFCLDGGERLSPDEYHARGGNDSLVHIDFMIGSSEMDIDGITRDDRREPVMRKGEWSF